MSEDRTEQPTGKKLQDARERGQIARSREAGQAASIIAATVALGWMGSAFMTRLASMMREGLTRMGDPPTAMIQSTEVRNLAVNGVASVGMLVGPIAFTAVATVVALHMMQGGWNFAPQAMTIDFARLNPAQGFKKFGLAKGGIELLKAVVAVSVIATIAYRLVSEYLPASREMARLAPADAAGQLWAVAVRLIKQAALGLLALAMADYLLQRHRLTQSLKMTKQEVQDESKMMQGNPEIKSRIKKIQREMFKRRMLSATKKATVVITNPTHFAVALEYRRSGMAAPVVVAKGQDLMAKRIKDIAREHGIPTVENVQLARALYATAEVGDVIPGPLFEAVAEVLAYFIRIKQLVI